MRNIYTFCAVFCFNNSEPVRSLFRISRSGAAALAVILVSLFLALGATAQTASDVTPTTFQPEIRRLSGALVFSGRPGLQAPPGAESLSVTIAEVIIEGALPEMEAASAAIKSRLTNGTVAVSEIFQAASDLESAYTNAGFVLVRVVLPAQTLRNGGRLRLVVVDGFVEDIDASAVPEPVRDRIQALTNSLIGRKGIRLAEIERSLLLAGDTYGVALGSALAAGATPGGTIVVLEPQYRRITGFVGIDNSISDELGSATLGGGLEFNGMLGMGEVFYLRASGYPGGNDGSGRGGFFDSDPRLRTLAAGAVFPLGDNGLTINVEATQSRTTPDTTGLSTSSLFERLSFRLYYPWVRSRSFNLTSQLSFDMQSDSQDIIALSGNLPIYRDKLRVLRVAGDAVWHKDSGAVIEAGAVASFGLDKFGARGADDATALLPLSRAGTDAEFVKLQISGRYRQQLGERFAFSLSGRGQTSFGSPLMESEQFGIASAQEISAFDAGTLSGDSGWVVRGEVSTPIETTIANIPLLVSPYFFLSTGAVYIHEPTAVENSKLQVSALGVGVDIISLKDVQFSAATLRLEYSKGFRDDDLSDGSRISLVGSFRF